MGDRNWEAFPRILYDPPLEPVRPALGMRGDDDLVCAKGAECIVYRLHGVSVADLSPRFDARLPELSEALVESLLSGTARAVFVGHPVPKWGVPCRRHDEHLLANVQALLQNRGPQGVAAARLVCDHQDPPLTRGMRPRRGLLRPLVPTSSRPPA